MKIEFYIAMDVFGWLRAMYIFVIRCGALGYRKADSQCRKKGVLALGCLNSRIDELLFFRRTIIT